jgi:predicted methyltransferase
MKRALHANPPLWVAVLLAGFFVAAPVRPAEPTAAASLAGAYRNLSFNVDGAGGAQRTMPALVLYPSQRYTWGQEKGVWHLHEKKLRLDQRPAWGDATVTAGGQLVFEFTKDGKRFTVTMYRADDAPPESATATTPAPPAVGASSPAPSAAPAYEFREEHDPDGIGKFYLGREIAHVLSHQGADWLERPEREGEEKPAVLIEALKLKPGDIVADIGAGTGYLARRLAQQVGPTGLVYANDIQPEMLDVLRTRCAEEKIENVKPLLGTITDPKLPTNAIDLAIMVDVYHEFSHPHEMLAAIVRALKPGGRLVFVEYRAEDPTVPIKRVHKMSEAQVRQEAEVHALEWVETNRVLPRQHIVVFRRKAEQ